MFTAPNVSSLAWQSARSQNDCGHVRALTQGPTLYIHWLLPEECDRSGRRYTAVGYHPPHGAGQAYLELCLDGDDQLIVQPRRGPGIDPSQPQFIGYLWSASTQCLRGISTVGSQPDAAALCTFNLPATFDDTEIYLALGPSTGPLQAPEGYVPPEAAALRRLRRTLTPASDAWTGVRPPAPHSLGH